MAQESFDNGLYRSMADFYPLSLSKLREEQALGKKAFEAYAINITLKLDSLQTRAQNAYDYHDQILVRY